MKKLLLIAFLFTISASCFAEKLPTERLGDHLKYALGLTDAERQQIVDSLMAKQELCRKKYSENRRARRICVATEFIDLYAHVQRSKSYSEQDKQQIKFRTSQLETEFAEAFQEFIYS